MALSSADRSAFNDYARNLRAFPALIAVADHLAACEALLGEIGRHSWRTNDCACEECWPNDLLVDNGKVTNWQDSIRALLGPAATKEGG